MVLLDTETPGTSREIYSEDAGTVYRFGLSCLVFKIQTILWTSVFVNMSYKFTCRRYCRFTLSDCQNAFSSLCEVFSSAEEVTLPTVREFK